MGKHQDQDVINHPLDSSVLMETTRILRLDRTDEPGEIILLQVSIQGPRDLDLKLVATEQEHIYHGALQQANLNVVRAKTYNANDDEWMTVLKHVFLQRQSIEANGDSLIGVEAVGSIASGTLTIVIRRSVGGVTQRLGLLKLQEDDEREEVSFPDWINTAVQQADALRLELVRAQASLESQKAENARLNNDLDEFVNAKREQDDVLFAQFAAILNEKKLKIRDQQRLLARAKIDPVTAANVQSDRRIRAESRGNNSLRKEKRKAGQLDVEASDVEMKDEGDQNEAASTDNEGAEEEDPDLAQETPEASDDENVEPEQTATTHAHHVHPNRLEVYGGLQSPERGDAYKESRGRPPNQPEIVRNSRDIARPHNNIGDDEDDETDDEL